VRLGASVVEEFEFLAVGAAANRRGDGRSGSFDSLNRAVSKLRRDGGRVGRMRPFEPPRLAAPLAAGLKRPALRRAGRAPTALPN
jgi:hypothetical protein